MKKVTVRFVLVCSIVCLAISMMSCKLDPEFYTVAFNTNSLETIESQSVQENTKATEPNNPEKDGFVFGGWYTGSELSISWNFNTPVTKNIALHAKWNIARTVTFNTDEGTSVDTQVISDNTTATEPEEPTKLDSLHAGWYTDTSHTTRWNFDSLITEDITLYTKWGISKERLQVMIDADEDVTDIDVSHMKDMSGLFSNITSFEGNISGWDVSNVTDMSFMFYEASTFNQDISGWDVGNVTNMGYMFCAADSFNQNLSGWDVSNVTDMECMFTEAASFNGDIKNWNVRNVTHMGSMFKLASTFNQNISSWFSQTNRPSDGYKIKNMAYMFIDASSYNQDLSGWQVDTVNFHDEFSFGDCPLYVDYHPNPSWADVGDHSTPAIG